MPSSSTAYTIRISSIAALAIAATVSTPAHAAVPADRAIVCGTLAKGSLKMDEWENAKAQFKNIIYYIVNRVGNDRVTVAVNCTGTTVNVNIKATAISDDGDILAEWNWSGLPLRGVVVPHTECPNSPFHAGVLGQLIRQADPTFRKHLRMRFDQVNLHSCARFKNDRQFENIKNIMYKVR